MCAPSRSNADTRESRHGCLAMAAAAFFLSALALAPWEFLCGLRLLNFGFSRLKSLRIAGMVERS
jgi:hypothetical protein